MVVTVKPKEATELTSSSKASEKIKNIIDHIVENAEGILNTLEL